MEQNRLYRNRKEAWIGGVAAGLSDYFNIDPIIIRAIFFVLALAGGGGVLVYIVLWIIVPERDETKTYGMHSKAEVIEETDSGTAGTGEDKAVKWDSQKAKGSLIGGIILITVGVLFMMQQLIHIPFEKLWPVLLIVLGILVVFTGFYGKKKI